MPDRPVTSGPLSPWRLDSVAPLSPNAWLRLDVVTRMFPPGVTDVLEVGCGQGGLGARLAQRYRYLGIEPDPASFAVAEQRLAHAGSGHVRNVRLEHLEAGRFDLVCAFEVLEHLEDDVAAVTAWAGRLRPGGWLLLSVPAHQRRFAAADELVGHIRRYDPQPLRALLGGAGLVDIELRQYGVPLGYTLEAGRNVLARRRLRALRTSPVAERTAASGRLFQPSGALRGALNRWATAPFRLLQRPFPAAGPGLVARARLPLT
ncbi:class I SAM-dependent methyltransferase [Dactylosporangium sp. NPDC005572]|uniref:class I SAM-dependent methyltransferase n=1 Tax=Dactylosporangium sp. NPDC005572 TaxID=3156889 RepID=UPI0033A3C69E